MKFSLRNALFSGVTLLLFCLFAEVAFRTWLSVDKKYPFWRPDLALQRTYYYETYRLLDSTIRQDDGHFDILILGGSVVADEWHSSVARRLRDTLRSRSGNPNIRYWNAANLGHCSRDNLQKYRLFTRQRFDLVLYYEAINETRLNNIPRRWFKTDYTHYFWYDEIDLLRRHAELRWTVIPFSLHFLGHRLAELVGLRPFVNNKPNAADQRNGGDLKTPPVYRANLEAIAHLARQRNEPLLLLNFDYYIPPTIRSGHGARANSAYAPCGLWSPIETWGTLENVEKGILSHQAVMRGLATNLPNVRYLNMHARMPKARRYFCDICHLTEDGSAAFADTLATYLLHENLPIQGQPKLLAAKSER